MPTTFELLECQCPRLEQAYATRSVPTVDGGTAPMDVYIPRDEGNLLYSIVRHLRPSATIEVGMANGLSTVFIAQGHRDNGEGRHIAIDPFQNSDWHGAGLVLVREAGLDRFVELREKPSHQALPELEQEGLRPSFVFIDGAHLLDYVMADFLSTDRMLSVGGMIAFDDSDWPAVSQVIRFAIANRGYEVAFPEIVIEPPAIRPAVISKLVRIAGRAVPKLGSKFRAEFMTPSENIGVIGRCVVLRKTGADQRDSQSRSAHRDF